MTGSTFLIAWLALPMLGLPLTRSFAMSDSRLGRIAAAFGAGAVILTLGMILLTATGVAATPARIGVAAVPAGLGALAIRKRPTLRPIDPSAFQWLALSAFAILVAAFAAGTARETSTDLLYFWGAKGEAFAAFRGIDAGFLGAPDHFLLHPDYPPLVPCLYALGAMAAGRFAWGAALLTAPLFLALALAAFWGCARDALGDGRAARWSALLGAMMGFGFLASEVAGNAEPALLFFETLSLAVLVFREPTPRTDFAASIALAGCALTKFEGSVFVLAAVAGFVVFEKRGSHRVASALRRISLPAVSLATWIAFCARHGLLDNYRGGIHGAFTLVNLSRILPALFRSASYGAGYLPWIVLIGIAVARRPARRSLAPAAAGLAYLAVNVTFYFHGTGDPAAWIDWSARRVLLTPLLCFLFALAAADQRLHFPLSAPSP